MQNLGFFLRFCFVNRAPGSLDEPVIKKKNGKITTRIPVTQICKSTYQMSDFDLAVRGER